MNKSICARIVVIRAHFCCKVWISDNLIITNMREIQDMKKYSVLSNFRFAYGPVWREKRIFIWDTLFEIFFSVAVPLFGTGLSALVVWLLGNEISVLSLIVTILLAFVCYAAANALQTYIVEKHRAHNIEIRLELFSHEIIKKELAIPLEASESSQARLLNEKASMAVSSNWEGIEGYFRYSKALGVGIFGLVVYAALAGTIHPLIVVILVMLSVISVMVDNIPQWYYNRIKDKIAKDNMTKEYIESVAQDVPAGKDIRVFGMSDWIIGKYDRAIMSTRRLTARQNVLAYVGVATTVTLNAIRDVCCYLYLIYLLQKGLSVSEFVFYLGVIAGFSNWFNEVSRNGVMMKKCDSQICDIRSYLDYCVQDNSGKLVPKIGFNSIEVVFDHVTFQYQDTDEPVLKDVSFKLKAGEHKALVGLNGAGKSTLVKLISGLYLPTSGDIYVNGINTRELNLNEYYSHQSAVFQDYFITSYTVGENIALSEQWDEDRVWNSVKQAGLYEVIKDLPKGLMTHLGKDLVPDGVSLSGGQIQKLLLARALYRNPSLILLDEPTAALDVLAESEIYEIYSKVLREKTSLFISHRLASTRFCDEIILLDEGKIVEQGTHEELMSIQGKYSELFKVQSRYYENGGESDVN